MECFLNIILQNNDLVTNSGGLFLQGDQENNGTENPGGSPETKRTKARFKSVSQDPEMS